MTEPLNLPDSLDRRDLLRELAAAGIVAGLGGIVDVESGIAVEASAREVLEGYAGQLSYEPGDRVGLHVSTTAKNFSVEIARVGATREVVWTKDRIAGAQHRTPENAFSHGCRWPAALEIEIPKDWRSGYYSAVLRGKTSDGKSLTGELFFVVRSAEPGRESKILLQLCTNTYNAYNTWGGSSLYTGPKGRAQRVSFERPWAGFESSTNFTSKYSGWLKWELPFVQWAERAGYRLEFAVNSDLEFRPEILKPYRLVLSVGHDEYWSSPMRDSLEAFIGDGGNVAFFSGNTAFWQVRSEDAGRVLTSWKADFDKDPVYAQEDKRLLTGMWSNRLIGRPENQLTGVSFAYAGYHKFFEFGGDGCYTIHRPEHWLFAGTGLARGETLGANHRIVGYECDGCRIEWKEGLPFPTHDDGTPANFEILGTAPAGLSTKGDSSLLWVSEALYGKNTKERVPQNGFAVLGCYTRGGTVVTTGCTEWTNGLRAKDPQVERITHNILKRLSV